MEAVDGSQLADHLVCQGYSRGGREAMQHLQLHPEIQDGFCPISATSRIVSKTRLSVLQGICSLRVRLRMEHFHKATACPDLAAHKSTLWVNPAKPQSKHLLPPPTPLHQPGSMQRGSLQVQTVFLAKNNVAVSTSMTGRESCYIHYSERIIKSRLPGEKKTEGAVSLS